MYVYTKIVESNIKKFDKSELISIVLNEYEKTTNIVIRCKYYLDFK